MIKGICVFGILVASLLTSHSGIAQNKISFIEKENQMDIMTNGQLITSYLYGPHLSKPILFPVKSPSGETVTRGFPLVITEGESQDHPHHTGISFTYGSNGDVNGNSFWANAHDKPPLTKEIKLPQIRHKEIIEIKKSVGKASITTRNHWVNKTGRPILEEIRIMEFQANEKEYTIDFTFELTAIDTTVTFTDTKEGMFAIRVADWLAEDANGTLFESTGQYLNAEGENNEENIWAKRSSWVRLEGQKEGKNIGIAILHHPSSLNYPTYWHARGYGCFAANPIGQYDFQKGRNLENPQHRTLILRPQESATFKFRMLIYEDGFTKQDMDAAFAKYSQ
jgi:hypothetical protein